MKKHLFLEVDYVSTIKLSAKENAQIKEWLHLASGVTQKLVAKKIIKNFLVEQLQVSLLICGDARIRALNHDHRSKDKVTDVLSFPSSNDLRKGKHGKAESVFLGDLAICWPQARRQAKQFEIGIFDEFIHLFFHGVLHLMGYDHELSVHEEKLMEKWEKLALNEFSKEKNMGKKKRKTTTQSDRPESISYILDRPGIFPPPAASNVDLKKRSFLGLATKAGTGIGERFERGEELRSIAIGFLFFSIFIFIKKKGPFGAP